MNQRHIVPVQRDLGILNQIILDVSALMEIKSAMGVIVVAPTAGSCGGLPGAILGAAASMALQNSLGMICDPAANRVEVPCLGKNIMAASNAVACANMALAGYDPVIPIDEVIRTMDDAGKSIPSEFRCNAQGGLSITETSRRIQKKLVKFLFTHLPSN